MRTEVLIVGAGPVGLSLAIGLRQHDVSVRIVDQRHGPQSEPRAAVIWPRGAEALEDLGVGAAIRQASNELASLHIFSRHRHLGTAQLGQLPSAFPKPLLIEQHVTERILVAHLATLGTKVEWATSAASPQLGSNGVAVALLHGADQRNKVAQCDWLVGCDGAHSAVRIGLGINFLGKPTANLQIVQVDAVPRWRFPACGTEGYYFLARGACLGCFPVAGGAYRFFCYTDDTHPHPQRSPTAAEMRDLIADVAGTPELRLDEVSWLNRTRFQTRFASSMRIGRALLAGDAAHVWPSLGGHGMNVGLQGAHNLAWKLAAVQRGGSPEMLLDTYEAEERHTVARFLKLMRLNMLERPSRPIGLPPRELALGLGFRLPGVSRLLEKTASDLTAHHRRSPLSQRSQHRLGRPSFLRRLRPGDRVPDVTVCLLQTRRCTRLHTQLTYQRWTVVLPAKLLEPACARIQEALAPWRGRVQLLSVADDAGSTPPQLKLGPNELMLVRPDRHIGLVTRHDDLARLRSYLERWVGKIAELSDAPQQGKLNVQRVAEGSPQASCTL
ncbi:FAD-dependent monooxygenase [Methylorubrum extorquens]